MGTGLLGAPDGQGKIVKGRLMQMPLAHSLRPLQECGSQGKGCRVRLVGKRSFGEQTAGRPSLSLTSCLCIPTIHKALSNSDPGKDTDGPG